MAFSTLPDPPPDKPAPEPTPKQSLPQKIIHEITKVMKSCRSLYIDTKFLLHMEFEMKILGCSITFTERKAIERIKADLWKMIPFSFIIVIPFAELALPPLLVLFPNMIPSPFLSKEKLKAAQKKILDQRLTLAKSIHASVLEICSKSDQKEIETLHKLLRDHSSTASDKLVEYNAFFKKSCNFNDMDSDFLLNMSMFLGKDPWTGFKTLNRAFVRPFTYILQKTGVKVADYLRPRIFPLSTIERRIVLWQLNKFLDSVRRVDRSLIRESIADLDSDHLRVSCVERGIETSAELTDETEMRKQIKRWVGLSNTIKNGEQVSSEVLYLSQVFRAIPDAVPPVPVGDKRRRVNTEQTNRFSNEHEIILQQLYAATQFEIIGLSTEQQKEFKQKLNEAVERDMKKPGRRKIRKIVESVLAYVREQMPKEKNEFAIRKHRSRK